MVVGSFAQAAYGRPRFTEVIELFVNRTHANAGRVAKALREFGIGMEMESVLVLANDPRAMITLGVKPRQIDILNFLDGVEFDRARERTIEAAFGDLAVPVIGLEDFIASKKSAGRPQDLVDLKTIEDISGSGS